MITFLGDVALLSDDIFSEYTPKTPYIFNLEYVVCNEGKPIPNKINIRSNFYDFSKVFSNLPVAVNVANNHALDYGIDGFNSTLNSMNKVNIPTIGDKPYWFNSTTCILAYTLFNGEVDSFSAINFNKEKAKRDILQVKEKGAECIIILMHWGVENFENPIKSQCDIGHALIDFGADLVVGCHPHCIQPIEKYKGKYICYSLGNCLFNSFNLDSHYNDDGMSTRKYRFKWCSWNRKSLAITFDEKAKDITAIDLLYQKHNKLLLKKSNYKIASLCKKNAFCASLNFKFRKYWLFFKSNSFVDGKIFDFNALWRELRK